MKNLRIAAAVVGLLTALHVIGLAQASIATPPRNVMSAKAETQARAMNTNATVHATTGVVKFIDANRLVIKRTPQNGREMTFVLNPSTERSGDVKVGSTVDIRYRSDADQRIATAVTVVHTNQGPFAHGSPQ